MGGWRGFVGRGGVSIEFSFCFWGVLGGGGERILLTAYRGWGVESVSCLGLCSLHFGRYVDAGGAGGEGWRCGIWRSLELIMEMAWSLLGFCLSFLTLSDLGAEAGP